HRERRSRGPDLDNRDLLPRARPRSPSDHALAHARPRAGPRARAGIGGVIMPEKFRAYQDCPAPEGPGLHSYAAAPSPPEAPSPASWATVPEPEMEASL